MVCMAQRAQRAPTCASLHGALQCYHDCLPQGTSGTAHAHACRLCCTALLYTVVGMLDRPHVLQLLLLLVPTNNKNNLMPRRHPQHERVLEVFEDMEAQGVQRDVRSFNVAIKSCGASPGRSLRSRDLAQALEYLAVMQRQGVVPTVVTYTSLCNLCAQVWYCLRTSKTHVGD